jgi:hypothetical protein
MALKEHLGRKLTEEASISSTKNVISYRIPYLQEHDRLLHSMAGCSTSMEPFFNGSRRSIVPYGMRYDVRPDFCSIDGLLNNMRSYQVSAGSRSVSPDRSRCLYLS